MLNSVLHISSGILTSFRDEHVSFQKGKVSLPSPWLLTPGLYKNYSITSSQKKDCGKIMKRWLIEPSCNADSRLIFLTCF